MNTEVSKIVAKLLGNPKKGAGLEEGEKFVLGTIMGRVSGTVVRTMPNGDAFTGLTGHFEAESATLKDDDGTPKAFTSGVLYLPGGFQERMIAATQGGAEVSFAIELSTVKDSNASGYSYRAAELAKTEAADPLAALRAAVAERRAALPAPSAEAPTPGMAIQGEAPVTADNPAPVADAPAAGKKK